MVGAKDESLAGFSSADRRTLATLLTRILDAHGGRPRRRWSRSHQRRPGARTRAANH
ncbi:hypothetical protein OHB12_35275 [Nocardia sp. NBC_01730]|uniref:hypothetical protein n=1 Tax=Nocardia sp. NBC_01730 TaxID=2975998 RepID=UPI002E0E1906|nr:hypothetical protein OHB12_35275 [Nocardia sp. NBC_01730]